MEGLPGCVIVFLLCAIFYVVVCSLTDRLGRFLHFLSHILERLHVTVE